MTILQVWAAVMVVGLLFFLAVGFGGGGNPNHPDHTPPGSGF